MRFIIIMEIKEILFFIFDDKILGYDGFLLCFFKKV